MFLDTSKPFGKVVHLFLLVMLRELDVNSSIIFIPSIHTVLVPYSSSGYHCSTILTYFTVILLLKRQQTTWKLTELKDQFQRAIVWTSFLTKIFKINRLCRHFTGEGTVTCLMRSKNNNAGLLLACTISLLVPVFFKDPTHQFVHFSLDDQRRFYNRSTYSVLCALNLLFISRRVRDKKICYEMFSKYSQTKVFHSMFTQLRKCGSIWYS